MGQPFTIRRADAADALQIAEVFLDARATMTYLPRLHTDEDTRAFFARVVANHETHVAASGARVAGFAVLRGDWLDHLYIHPSLFNRQIGTRLFETATWSRPDGLQFWVFQQNTGAHRFYERLGAKAVEFTDGSGNEEKLPDVRYEWG